MPEAAENVVIALVPLDERPVNTRYPQMLGAIAGAEVLLPPAEHRGRQRDPADRNAVQAWLRGEASVRTNAVIVSTDYLLYGNLINARISRESAAEVMPRLGVLDELSRAGKLIYAFSLITRVSNADDCVEEPDYWCTFGTRFYRYSQLLHRREAGALEPGDAEALEALRNEELPPHLVSDWLQRRLRNHTLNLALLDLLDRQTLEFLLVTSDDTSPWGLPSREKTWLESWARLLRREGEAPRLLIHPGADEVGSALTARLICARRGDVPALYPLYAVPGGEEITAPYEDRAVRITVEGQIRACGGRVAATPEEADIILGVLPPSPRRTEFRADFADAERAERTPYYEAFFRALARLQEAGKPIALGDVTYPNGSDPLAIEMLLAPGSPLEPASLAAYGAWNTAGNTLGVVVAQAVLSRYAAGDPARERAQARFLAHRFLEDWGYQAMVRREAREKVLAAFGRKDPDPESEEQQAFARAAIEEGLTGALATLQARGIGAGLHLVPGSVRLPWRRTFEADFDLAE